MAIDLRAAFENQPPVLDFIWPGFLAGTVGALVAPGATGKSFWALEAAMSVACGATVECGVVGVTLSGLLPHPLDAWSIWPERTQRSFWSAAFTP